jgi:hypothetical protein
MITETGTKSGLINLMERELGPVELAAYSDSVVDI